MFISAEQTTDRDAAPGISGPPEPQGSYPATGTVVVLGAVNLLLAGFAAAQVIAASEGGRHVLQTAGLTYAEYARSGFFQLLAVATIAVALVAGLRSIVADRSRPVLSLSPPRH